MFFRSQAGQGIENMGEMRGSLLDGPVFHGISHDISHGRIQLFAQFDGLLQGFIAFLGRRSRMTLSLKTLQPKAAGGRRLAEIQGGVQGFVIGDGLDGVPTGRKSAHDILRTSYEYVLLCSAR